MTASEDTVEPVSRPTRRRSSMRQEYKAFTRQRLADAAILEFEERGYAATRIEDIARRAGTSRATFYSHYTGKVELIEGLWDVVRLRLVRLYRDLGATRVRDEAAIARWLERTFAFYRENRRRLLAVHEAIALEQELAPCYREHSEEVIGLLAPLVVPLGGEPPADVRFRAMLLSVQHERLCFLWILRQAPFDEQVVLRTLTREWVRALGMPAG